MVMAETKKETLEVVEETVESSPWYYFYSVGCGWCKKTEPIVDTLNKEGHDILKLDVSDPENKKISDELKKEFNAQCGTPWLVNADTGKGICGFREKDIIEKWLDGEDIPAPPRPKGPMPKPPFQGSTGKEETAWKKEYKKWAKENSHLPKIQSADEILKRPRPKTEPPKPPNPQSTDDELETWGKEYDKWKNENSHLPNLQPVENIINNFKQRRDGTQQPVQQQPVQNQQALTGRIDTLEQKLDKLMKHLGVQ
jgi:thiol-disulfide isomerase/thioredoxin